MPEEQKVTANEILQSAGSVQEGTFLQRTGLKLALAVGGTATLVTFALVAQWFVTAPNPPVLAANADPAAAKAMLDNYKILQQTALEPLTTLFDSIVAKVLLPVFTSILGFIFARANANS